MKRLVIAALSLVITLTLTPTSHATLLGVAGDYNAFIFGDMNTRATDSAGPIAVGGNYTSSNFGMGGATPGNQYSLISGGNVDYTDGTISNGGIFANGYVNLHGQTVNGDVTANGLITITPPSDGTVTGTKTSYAGIASPINFTNEKNYLLGLSSGPSGLSTMTANGSTVVNIYGSGPQIHLTGNNPVNIFSLDGNYLNDATNLFLNLGTDQTTIINISGTNIELADFAPIQEPKIWNGVEWVYPPWNGQQENILFNFYEATSLSIHNIGWKGSILAPLADTAFYSAHIDGTLIANSLTWENAAGSAGGEYHWYPFDNDLDVDITPSAPEPVPEPATMLLFGTGLVGLATRFRKKSQKKSN